MQYRDSNVLGLRDLAALGAAKQPTLVALERHDAASSIKAKALIFSDPVSLRLLSYIERLAPSEAPVLIVGETGTGKELVAQHIHHMSGRKGPFLAVNCGAISEQLSESELFGHEAGSFTGAVGRRPGWFEAADGGTLFLDEVGDLPLPMQVKLLRVLQEREVVRIGSRKSIPVDVRVIAATNLDLEHAVAGGQFRRDLFYRLNVAQAQLPPLRDRPGDVLPLVQHFLDSYSLRMNRRPPQLTAAAADALLRHAWPGNIRELENAVHFALLMSNGEDIGPEHLRVTHGLGAYPPGAAHWAVEQHNGAPRHEHETPIDIITAQLQRAFSAPDATGGDSLYDRLERVIVTEAFRHCDGNQSQSAALLGITRNMVRTLLKRHGLLSETPFSRGVQEGQWSLDASGV
jgi:DNA-binding NtrC family response regulator